MTLYVRHGMCSISRAGGVTGGPERRPSQKPILITKPLGISTGRSGPAADRDSRTRSPFPRSRDRQNSDRGEHFCRGRRLCHLTMPPVLHHSHGDSGRLEAAGPISGHSSRGVRVVHLPGFQGASGPPPQPGPHPAVPDYERHRGVLLCLSHLP